METIFVVVLWFYLLWGPLFALAVALHFVRRQSSLSAAAVPVLALLGTLVTALVAGPVVAGVKFFPAAPWWAAAVGVGKGPDLFFLWSIGSYFVLLLSALALSAYVHNLRSARQRGRSHG